MTPILAALIALAGPAAAQDPARGISETYACDGGKTLRVAYLNPKDGPSLAVVDWDGRLVPMEEGVTGSGVRYVAYEGGLVWHSKGSEGVLLHDEGAEETLLLGGCQAR